VTAQTPENRFEDRLFDEIVAVVSQNPPSTTPPTLSPRRGPSRAAVAISVAALVAAVLVAVSALNGPRAGIAQATVLKRARAALAQPGGILYVQAVDRGGGICLGEEAPARCIGTGPAASGDSNDVNYTYREWIGPSGDQQHTVYDTGDEAASNGDSQQLYNPANDTVTTTTEAPSSSGAASSGGIPAVADLTIPAIQGIYERAQRGEAETRLQGTKTIAGQSVYELSITPEPGFSLVLDVATGTFLPVRAVMSSSRAPARTFTDTTSFVAKVLPDTPANETLLKMFVHRSARQLSLTQTQLSAERSTVRPEYVIPAAPASR
jgi:hypothetical protein